jgi:hypothetical protein
MHDDQLRALFLYEKFAKLVNMHVTVDTMHGTDNIDTLMTFAGVSSEIFLNFYRFAQRHIPENNSFSSHRHGNIRTH